MDADNKPIDEHKGYLLLWIGVLLPPVVWLLQFQIRYSLVQWVCAHQSRLVLHVLSAVFFLLIAGGGILSWRFWVSEGKHSPAGEESASQARNQFLSLLGILMSSLFALVLLAQTIAQIMVDPCRN